MPTTPTDVQVPTRLPVVPGLVLHGTYLLTDREPINRGDTLDAAVLGDGSVALLVADVAGHGFAASMAAMQVRTVLRERLLAGAGLVGAADALDGYLRRASEIGGVTLCAAVIDPVTGAVDFVTAGHAGPTVVSSDGTLRRAEEQAPYPPLGFERRRPIRLGRLQAATDELVLLNTCDGGPIALDEAVAAALASSTNRNPADRLDSVCGDAVRRIIPASGLPDDAVLLAALRSGIPPPLSIRLPARRASVERARGLLDGWLDEVGAGLLDHAGLVQALDEVTTNVVEHAYSDGDGTMRVDARLDRFGAVTITVTDDGAWASDAPTGFGLTMAAGLADTFRILRGARGSSVELGQELTRPVRMSQAVAAPGAPPPPWEADLQLESSPGVVKVRGAVDDLSAEIFRAAVIEASAAGNRDVTVDLVGTTRLASPGVQSLHESIMRSRVMGGEIEILAKAGSLVARVLTVTAVPFRAVT